MPIKRESDKISDGILIKFNIVYAIYMERDPSLKYIYL